MEYSPDYAGHGNLLPQGQHPRVMSLYDQHFRKLCWAAEHGHNYDLKIAESLYHNAVEDLIRYTQGLPLERILFPVGNDFLHVDNLNFTTQKGTPLGADSEGRYAKIVAMAFGSLVVAIERMASI